MTELKRKALMGDRDAQRLCAEKGIVLPCPRCGGAPVEKAFVGAGMFYIECNCGSETHCFDSKQKALLEWNTRPAPPVGRCGECKHYIANSEYESDECQNSISGLVSVGNRFDFCSYFEPKGNE